MQLSQAKPNPGYLVAFSGNNLQDIAEQVVYGLQLKETETKWWVPAGLSKELVTGLSDIKTRNELKKYINAMYGTTKKVDLPKVGQTVVVSNDSGKNVKLRDLSMNDLYFSFDGRESTDGKEIITGDTVEGDGKPQTPDNESYTAKYTPEVIANIARLTTVEHVIQRSKKAFLDDYDCD